MQRSQSPQRSRRGTFLRMWIQRASCTSQLDKKSMLHLPRNKHGQDRRRSIPACCWCAGALLFLALGAAFSKAGAADVADPHHVTAVRFWSLGSVTRIAIETDGDFQVKSDRLDNPDRLFFDLTGTKPTLSRKSITVIPVEDHFVRQIRVALHRNHSHGLAAQGGLGAREIE